MSDPMYIVIAVLAGLPTLWVMIRFFKAFFDSPERRHLREILELERREQLEAHKEREHGDQLARHFYAVLLLAHSKTRETYQTKRLVAQMIADIAAEEQRVAGKKAYATVLINPAGAISDVEPEAKVMSDKLGVPR